MENEVLELDEETIRKNNCREYWIKNIKSALRTMKESKPDCMFNISLVEQTAIIVALKELGDKFYNGTDLEPIFNQLFLKKKGKKHDLFIKTKELDKQPEKEKVTVCLVWNGDEVEEVKLFSCPEKANSYKRKTKLLEPNFEFCINEEEVN